MSETRDRVEEWRITSGYWTNRVIRYWIERDPAYGGVAAFEDAKMITDRAERMTVAWSMLSMEDACRYLLNEVPCANSVEVCDLNGNGITIHRDWP